MEQEGRLESRAAAIRGRMLVFLVAVAAVGSSIFWVSLRSRPKGRVRPQEAVSAYLNTRPGVKYLGDSSCIRCHAEISESYRRHPMGRSLAPIAKAPPTPDATKEGGPLFEAQGFQYGLEHRDGRVIHKETRSDARGRIIAQNEAEVQFVLGSGSQALAYLIERDGFLFESPITWYPRERRWDLSPGYETNNLPFQPADPSRMPVLPREPGRARGGHGQSYQPPIFRGHAIGCERCHGPGELHVGGIPSRRRPGHDDRQPRPSGALARDAVCEQCHLIGDQRDRSRWTVATRTIGPACRFIGSGRSSCRPAAPRKTDSSARSSRCTRAAASAPAEAGSAASPATIRTDSPEPEEKVAYYRKRCLECHADRGCTLPPAVRLARSRDDDCTGCHMPRSMGSEILHVATTNHRSPAAGTVPSGPRLPVRTRATDIDRSRFSIDS